MTPYFFTSVTGRIALLLLALDILLPYLLRRTRLSQFLGLDRGQAASPYLHRMWPHYWCGYALAFFSLAHTWVSMQSANMKRINMTGLWFATVAIVLLLFQVALGLFLQDRALPTSKLIRSWHYWLMLALVVLIGAHAWLND